MVDIGDASTLTEQKTTRLSLFIDSTLNFMRLFRKNRAAVVGFSVVLIFGMVAIFAKQVMPYDHLKQNLVPELIYQPPSSEHWMGTDDLGRDVFSRFIWGSRTSMLVGFSAAGVSALL